MQYLELYNIDKQLCDWIWKLICKYQNFTSFAANCTIQNYSCKKLVNTNMLNVDSKDTVSCIWFTSFRNWKHNYKYFIKRAIAKSETQSVEKQNGIHKTQI